ncbi:MAG: hypothetical protein MK193_03620 [Lentisphaeria bacterium]|nr:hypothetical protein [Lentisphaeria bacterium]
MTNNSKMNIENWNSLETFLSKCQNNSLKYYGYPAFKGMLIVEQIGLIGPTATLLNLAVTDEMIKNQQEFQNFLTWLDIECNQINQDLKNNTLDIGWNFYQQQTTQKLDSKIKYLKGICDGLLFVLNKIQVQVQDLEKYYYLILAARVISFYPTILPDSKEITKKLNSISKGDQIGTKLFSDDMDQIIEGLIKTIYLAYEEENREFELNNENNFELPCNCANPSETEECCT